MNEHMTPEEIERLLNGQLPEADLDRWFAHLHNCEQCLASFDKVWTLPVGFGRVPPLGPARLGLLERRIIDRIHTFEVGKQSLRLALLGPIVLLRGLFGSSTHKR
jgi:hypothetical protein